MKLKELLDGIEDPARDARFSLASNFFNPPIQHQVEIEFGPNTFEDLCQSEARTAAHFLRVESRSQGSEYWGVEPRRQDEPLVDDNGGDTAFSIVAQKASSTHINLSSPLLRGTRLSSMPQRGTPRQDREQLLTRVAIWSLQTCCGLVEGRKPIFVLLPWSAPVEADSMR